MKRRPTLLIVAVSLTACGGVSAPSQSASAAARSSPSATEQVLLDLSDATFHGVQSQVFTAAGRWDLMYVYDCGADEYAGLDISISPKGQGIFGGDLVVAVHSGAGSGVVEGLAPGSFSLVLDIGQCPWHIVAGSNLETDRLLSLAPGPPAGAGLKQHLTVDGEGVGDKKQHTLTGPSDSNLLFAYDCGSAGGARFAVELIDSYGSAHDQPPYHITASGLVSNQKKGWGVLRYLPILSRSGYVPPPGSLLLQVGGCKWHLIVGSQLELTRPLLPSS